MMTFFGGLLLFSLAAALSELLDVSASLGEPASKLIELKDSISVLVNAA